MLFISQWSSTVCIRSQECPTIPSSPDELALHNGRCCVWTICKPGNMPEMCDEGDTKTTKCSPCPDGQFISNSYESYRMMICSRWSTPCASPEKKTIGGGNSTHDYICECNVDAGYIEDPSTPGVCKNVCPAGEQMDDHYNICNPCQNGTFKLQGGAQCEPCSSCVDFEFECNRTHDHICKVGSGVTESVPERNFILLILIAPPVLLVVLVIGLYVYIRKSENCTCLGINLYAQVHSLEKRICVCCYPRNVNNNGVGNDDEVHVGDQLLHTRDSGNQESLEPCHLGESNVGDQLLHTRDSENQESLKHCRLGESNVDDQLLHARDSGNQESLEHCRLGESNADDPNDNTVRLDIDNQNQAIRDDSTDTRLKEIVAQTENECEGAIEACRSVTVGIDDTAGLKEQDQKLNNMLDAANHNKAIPNYDGQSFDGSQNKRNNENAAENVIGSNQSKVEVDSVEESNGNTKRQTIKLDTNIKLDNDENEEIGRRVMKHFDAFSAGLDPRGSVLDKLFADGIITADIYSEINDKTTEPRDRCSKLLRHLNAIHHPTRFKVFLEAVEAADLAYKYLVDLIKKV